MLNVLTSYPFKNRFTNNGIQESTTKGEILIGDDVWIGYGCVILSGAKIGKGAVIGAGSVVTKDIPPYAVYCGTEIKKYRFSDSVIKKLEAFELSSFDFSNPSKAFELLYTQITEDNVDEILKEIQELKIK